MHPKSLQQGKYFVKHTSQTVQAVVTSLERKLRLSTFESDRTQRLAMNDIGVIR